MLDTIAARRGAIGEHFSTWRPLTLHDALDQAASRYPDRPFVLTPQQKWSYAEMATWSHRIAANLWAEGLRPGEKVAIIMANYPEFIALKYAISRVGAVATPINILNRRDELRYLLQQSDTAFLITMDGFREANYLAMLDEIAPNWEEKAGGEAL